MDLLISVRRASLFDPIPVSRTLRVAGRLPAVPRDQLERVTCRATNDILETTVACVEVWRTDVEGRV